MSFVFFSQTDKVATQFFVGQRFISEEFLLFINRIFVIRCLYIKYSIVFPPIPFELTIFLVS